jgi:hypothetical protein
MINVDDRLLDNLNDKETYLLLILATYFGETYKSSAFPSNKTLMKRTKWSLDKLRAVKNSLIEKDVIEIEERFDKGRQTTNMYHIKTNGMLGYYVPIDIDKRNIGVGKPNHTGGRKKPPHPQSEKPTTIKHYTEESINKKEVLDYFSVNVKSNGQGSYVSPLFGEK